MSGIDWRCAGFAELSGTDVYDMLALRQRVFMLEQAIRVLDADGADAEAMHLLGRADGELVAYARIFAGDPVRIGRVAVTPAARGHGTGRRLMIEALKRADGFSSGTAIKISAQAHLADFYASLGFVAASEIYDDHGVPHLDMVRSISAA